LGRIAVHEYLMRNLSDTSACRLPRVRRGVFGAQALFPPSSQVRSRELIKGTIIGRWRDGYGEIVVAEDGGIRSLYFGDGVLQSAILPDRPEALIMDYGQAMMCALLFRNAPESALLIGLGGCSLVNFLLKAAPTCILDVIELRGKVIEIAYEFFLPPGGNERLRIVQGAGEDFVRQRDCPRYDLILVDAFDDGGPAAPLLDREFLGACRGRLNRRGVFAINVWNRPRDDFPALFAKIGDVFGSNTSKLLLSEAYRNAIVFGFEDFTMPGDLHAYREAAKALGKKHLVNFPLYLRRLYWQNFI